MIYHNIKAVSKERKMRALAESTQHKTSKKLAITYVILVIKKKEKKISIHLNLKQMVI